MLRFGKTFASMLMVFGLGLAGSAQAAPAKRLALVQVNQQALYFTQITQGAASIPSAVTSARINVSSPDT